MLRWIERDGVKVLQKQDGKDDKWEDIPVVKEETKKLAERLRKECRLDSIGVIYWEEIAKEAVKAVKEKINESHNPVKFASFDSYRNYIFEKLDELL